MSEVFVTLSTFAEYGREPLEALERAGVVYELNRSGKRMMPDEVIERAAASKALIAGVEPYTDATLGALPRLACICRCGAGVDNIDLESARRRNVAVFNTPWPPVQAVAELTVAMMLGLLRRLPEQSLLMRARRWERIETHLLARRHVGIVGLGKIGRRVAEICGAIGAKVSAVEIAPDEDWARRHNIRLASWSELLAQSDILSLHASVGASPLRVGAAEIARMRPGAILLNCARGEMVDEAALIDALKSRRLGGAGLDVFEAEPYTGELTQLDNVILTPHCATLPVESRVAMEIEAVEAAIGFLRGDAQAGNRVV
ncbi:MAG: phosphoglycerate dehydrogenase [Verrucomicrobiae bacterium]|nr:phosphoglycerate dehydrogenase [Verrucomicrobiae bacterium]